MTSSASVASLTWLQIFPPPFRDKKGQFLNILSHNFPATRVFSPPSLQTILAGVNYVIFGAYRLPASPVPTGEFSRLLFLFYSLFRCFSSSFTIKVWPHSIFFSPLIIRGNCTSASLRLSPIFLLFLTSSIPPLCCIPPLFWGGGGGSFPIPFFFKLFH